MKSIATTLFLLHCAFTYIVELEIQPTNKACISELFIAGEPISVTASIHDKLEVKSLRAYLTIETDKLRVLAQKRYEVKSNQAKVVYNNDQDRTLFICVDNFENNPISIELDIKSKGHLSVHEFAPSKGEYAELDEAVIEVSGIIDQAYTYFTQNEDYSDQILKMTGRFETTLMWSSFATLLVLAVIGLIQTRAITKDLKAKKIF